MSTLHIFGCSFSKLWASTYQWPNRPNVVPWPGQLAEKLNVNMSNHAEGLASLGWMMYISMKERYNFKEDDYIIFQATGLHRGFVDKNRPSLSIPWDGHTSWNTLNDDEKEGYKFYFMNIYDEEVLRLQLQSWIWAMAHYTRHVKNPIIFVRMDGLEDLELPDNWIHAKGSLYKSSSDEFNNISTKKLEEWFVKNSGDPRENHLSSINHPILTDMFYNAFINRKQIDLDKLEKNLYDKLPNPGNDTWNKDWLK